MDTKNKIIDEVIESFMEDNSKPYEELDWWMYDDQERVSFNIHNHGNDIDMFQVDVYPYAKEMDRPDFSTWDTVRVFNFNNYKG
jgi:hypothetical protein